MTLLIANSPLIQESKLSTQKGNSSDMIMRQIQDPHPGIALESALLASALTPLRDITVHQVFTYVISLILTSTLRRQRLFTIKKLRLIDEVTGPSPQCKLVGETILKLHLFDS